MKTSLRRILACALATSAFLFITAAAAVAQFKGEEAEIPQDPPTNWTTGWVGWPLLGIAVAVVLGVAIYYSVKMIRLRYPARS